MDFISMVREKASAAAISAVKTSGDVVETVKSKIAIADKEQEIKNIFGELGRMMYEAYKEGAELDAEKAAEQCILLDEHYAEIEALRGKLNEIKNVNICPECGEKVKTEHSFCPNCGHNMKAEEKPECGCEGEEETSEEE